jgi:hypothetical protein
VDFLFKILESDEVLAKQEVEECVENLCIWCCLKGSLVSILRVIRYTISQDDLSPADGVSCLLRVLREYKADSPLDDEYLNRSAVLPDHLKRHYLSPDHCFHDGWDGVDEKEPTTLETSCLILGQLARIAWIGHQEAEKDGDSKDKEERFQLRFELELRPATFEHLVCLLGLLIQRCEEASFGESTLRVLVFALGSTLRLLAVQSEFLAQLGSTVSILPAEMRLSKSLMTRIVKILGKTFTLALKNTNIGEFGKEKEQSKESLQKMALDSPNKFPAGKSQFHGDVVTALDLSNEKKTSEFELGSSALSTAIEEEEERSDGTSDSPPTASQKNSEDVQPKGLISEIEYVARNLDTCFPMDPIDKLEWICDAVEETYLLTPPHGFALLHEFPDEGLEICHSLYSVALISKLYGSPTNYFDAAKGKALVSEAALERLLRTLFCSVTKYLGPGNDRIRVEEAGVIVDAIRAIQEQLLVTLVKQFDLIPSEELLPMSLVTTHLQLLAKCLCEVTGLYTQALASYGELYRGI